MKREASKDSLSTSLKMQAKKLSDQDFDFDDDPEDEQPTTGLLSKTKGDDDDEEYARKLQEALTEETRDLRPSPKLQPKSATISSLPVSRPAITPTIELPTSAFIAKSSSPASVVSPTPEFSQLLDLQRRSFTVKIMCAIDFLFSVYALVSKTWWLGFGAAFAPLGAYGAHKYMKRLVLVYLNYLVLNLVLELMFSFLKPNALVISLSILIILIQVCILYYVYQFWKKMPADGVAQFQQAEDVPLQTIVS